MNIFEKPPKCTFLMFEKDKNDLNYVVIHKFNMCCHLVRDKKIF